MQQKMIREENVLIRFSIPGDPIVKKNTMRFSAFDKNNKPRRYPLVYYTKAYREWAKQAVIACTTARGKYSNSIDFPIQEPVILTCWFFMRTHKRVDLSNLYEGVQDVLCGNAKINIRKDLFHILQDDSSRFIVGHDGSRVAYDPVKPRTEVCIQSASL